MARMPRPDLYKESFRFGGRTVRVYEPSGGRNFRMEVWDGKAKKPTSWSLGHRDRVRAAAEAGEYLRSLTETSDLIAAGRLMLQSLLDVYFRSEAFAQLTPKHQALKRTRLKSWVTVFGPRKEVRSFDGEDIKYYRRCRSEGLRGLRRAGPRTSHHDYAVLRSVVRWALYTKHSDGSRLLRDDPLAGLRVDKGGEPTQVLVTQEQYESLLVSSRSGARPAWIEVMLVVAEGTGRRINAIRNLRWEDVDFATAAITWRSQHDKMGHEDRQVPAFSEVVDALRRWRKKRMHTTWVFENPKAGGRPVSDGAVRNAIVTLCRSAGVQMPRFGGWHSFRRKFITELHLAGWPLKAIMHLTGHRSEAAILGYIKVAETADVQRLVCSTIRHRAYSGLADGEST